LIEHREIRLTYFIYINMIYYDAMAVESIHTGYVPLQYELRYYLVGIEVDTSYLNFPNVKNYVRMLA